MVAIVGPSGAGKDTLIACALAQMGDARAARRVITRPYVAGGEPYEGVNEAEFARREGEGRFALSWRAHGLGYAIPKSELAGEGVLFVNLSRAVLLQAKQQFPGLRVIVVTAPPAVLAARLAARGREDGADQAARLARAGFDLPPGLDVQEVVNDTTPEIGCTRFMAALYAKSA